jgi:signal transduction histidine kinase
LIVSPLTKLLKGNVNGSAQKLYTVMLRNSRKLQELINQLLDISNIDKNELKLNLKLHDFNRQVRAIAAMFQSIAEEKNIEFIIKGIQENLV